jgi:hypothetical protein
LDDDSDAIVDGPYIPERTLSGIMPSCIPARPALQLRPLDALDHDYLVDLAVNCAHDAGDFAVLISSPDHLVQVMRRMEVLDRANDELADRLQALNKQLASERATSVQYQRTARDAVAEATRMRVLNVERSADAHTARVALKDSEAKHNGLRKAWKQSIERLGETMAQLDERDALIEAFDRAAMALHGCTAAQLVKQLQVPPALEGWPDGSGPVDKDVIDPMDFESEPATGRDVTLPMFELMETRR